MKKMVLILAIILYSIHSVSAQKGSVSGSLVDQSNQEGIPYATIALYHSGNHQLVTGTASSANGTFEISNVPFGTYQLVFSFIGFQNDTLNAIQVNASQRNLRLGTIQLEPATANLEGVSVTAMAQTVQQKLDRKTYRAADFETARGGTATDVLSKLPSISVDPDGTVSVRGTTDFMVYLNGKPTQLESAMLLAQIPAEIIEKIEVITVPSAKYDAQGKGGIINITTRRAAADGLSIAANGLLGGAPWGNLTDPISGFKQNDNRYGGGLNLIYSKNKFSAYAGGNYNYRQVNGLREGDARLLQSDGSYYHMVARGERPEWYINAQANAGFDYRLSEATTISAGYFYGNRVEGRSAFYVYNNKFGAIDKAPLPDKAPSETWVYNPNTDNRYGLFHTANLDLSHQFNETRKLNISGLFEHSSLSRKLDNQDFGFNNSTSQIGALERHFQQSDDTPLDGMRLSIDFEKELNNGHTLSLGAQPQYLKHSGSFSYDTLHVASNQWADYGSLENAIDLRRGIYAGYFDYSGSINKLVFQAGLRLEYTDQSLSMENPNYFSIFEREAKSEYLNQQLDWFPSLHLKYDLKENSNLMLAASRRISRPPTKNMAPFLYRRHYEVYVVGDPALKPEYVNTAEISWNQKLQHHDIGLTAFYRGIDNAIFRVNTVFEEENVLIRSYTNSGKTQSLGAEMNANIQLGKKAKLFVGGSLFDYHIKADIFGYQENNRSMNWGLKTNLNLFITKKLQFSADIDLESATVTAQGENEMNFMTNAALSYQAVDNWSLSIRLLDALSTNNTGLNTRAFDAKGTQIFFQETTYYRYGPILELGISYNLNMRGKNSKKTGSAFGKDQF